ncbi:hypothetical protein PPYR_11650 [Photinus pyralis]|uniref:Heparanase n=1 Tax=Photinus pyralis TaxID=7054 RepID=A0A5N4ABX1_PHOPY|nr:uncharacterized protein LOC116177018 [Photinus pyralis]KAB0794811.1 hypothetical protein PPYR_11650 [Photinus pyralis]
MQFSFIMFPKKLLIFLVCAQFSVIKGKEAVFMVNSKKPLNVVSERFLSFSVEASDFLKNLKNDATYVTFQHLKPAYIRITDNPQFSQNKTIPWESNLVETPMTWKEICKWFVSTGLTPIFAINSENYFDDAWVLNTLRPILEMNEEIGFNSYWEIRYKCETNPSKYQKRLKWLKQIMEEYPSASLVCGNDHSCMNSDSNQKLNGTVEAIISETLNMESSSPTWIIMPQAEHLESFSSALKWAKKIGETAADGNKVVFWKAGVASLSDSAVSWIALLYKQLVGSTVLDVSTNMPLKSDAEVSAHCAKQHEQEDLVLFIVNSGKHNFTASLRVASHPTTILVKSYILTSEDNGTYLNNEKLTPNLLNTSRLIFTPEIQTLKLQPNLNLIVPPRSVSFFVLPYVGITVCGRDNTKSISEFSLLSRYNPIDPKTTSRLDAFKQKLRKLKLKNAWQRGPVEDSEVASDFRDFLAHKTPKLKEAKFRVAKNDEPEPEIFLELTKDEVRQILLERMASNEPISNKGLERKMRRAPRYKGGPRGLWHEILGKKHAKRDINARLAQKKGGMRDGYMLADFAPAHYGEREVYHSEEEELRSGERFVDERLRFLTGTGNIELDNDEKSEYSIHEDFGGDNREDKMEFMGEYNHKRNHQGSRWMKHSRNKRNIPERPTRVHHTIVKKRENSIQDMASRLKSLKEKVENRIKMNNWIRNKQKQNLMESRSKKMPFGQRNAFVYYTPKVSNKLVAVDKTKSVEKMPSFSRENVDELPTGQVTMKRRARALAAYDITENLVEDENNNKIVKMKQDIEIEITTTSTTKPDLFTVAVEYNGTENQTENYYGEKKAGSDQSLFQILVEKVATFIENIYGQVSVYFMR